jgi:hypothetical protein
MKDVIELAREAGFTEGELAFLCDNFRRFAELVLADELVKPCCGNFVECQQVCMPRAATQERGACAQVCEKITEGDPSDPNNNVAEYTIYGIAMECAAAIRARGETK